MFRFKNLLAIGLLLAVSFSFSAEIAGTIASKGTFRYIEFTDSTRIVTDTTLNLRKDLTNDYGYSVSDFRQRIKYQFGSQDIVFADGVLPNKLCVGVDAKAISDAANVEVTFSYSRTEAGPYIASAIKDTIEVGTTKQYHRACNDAAARWFTVGLKVYSATDTVDFVNAEIFPVNN